jgi:hypothetical protein
MNIQLNIFHMKTKILPDTKIQFYTILKAFQSIGRICWKDNIIMNWNNSFKWNYALISSTNKFINL